MIVWLEYFSRSADWLIEPVNLWYDTDWLTYSSQTTDRLGTQIGGNIYMYVCCPGGDRNRQVLFFLQLFTTFLLGNIGTISIGVMIDSRDVYNYIV